MRLKTANFSLGVMTDAHLLSRHKLRRSHAGKRLKILVKMSDVRKAAEKSGFADLTFTGTEQIFGTSDARFDADGLTHKRGTDSIAGLSFFVPKTAKNIEAVLRYVNWLSKYENYHFLQFGKEGVNHKNVDGVPQVIPATGAWIQNSNANIDYTMSINGYNLQDDDLNVKVLATSYPFPMEDVFEAYRISSLNADVIPFVRATLVEAAPLVQTLTDESAVVLIQSITALAADFDKVYDTGVAQWRTSGAQRIVDERRAKYNGQS
ncbi:hypothetical protein FACS1894172_15880 [Spirochaetia bacterium]|nr:hypothetical protein FACS1894164_10700 [Spirochaetia bacterium]GHU34914.1 hypothetical protein FACS1894172_15880 [Spirochaetia bacterium]